MKRALCLFLGPFVWPEWKKEVNRSAMKWLNSCKSVKQPFFSPFFFVCSFSHHPLFSPSRSKTRQTSALTSFLSFLPLLRLKLSFVSFLDRRRVKSSTSRGGHGSGLTVGGGGVVLEHFTLGEGVSKPYLWCGAKEMLPLFFLITKFLQILLFCCPNLEFSWSITEEPFKMFMMGVPPCQHHPCAHLCRKGNRICFPQPESKSWSRKDWTENN